MDMRADERYRELLSWGGIHMQKKSRVILSIAAALAALSASVAPEQASAATSQETDATAAVPGAQPTPLGQPNLFVTAGEDLLGLIVTRRPDGTVLAAHYSHASHASHASHHSHFSHYSSR
jgi:hypothetical protein